MNKRFYSPKTGQGYKYHVVIYFEALLTYKQALEIKYSEDISIPPDDSTDYYRLEWRKCEKISFIESEWNNAIKRTRDVLKREGENFIEGKENNRNYVYFYGTIVGLRGKVLKRAHVYITHKAPVKYDQEKFNKHLTKLGKGIEL